MRGLALTLLFRCSRSALEGHVQSVLDPQGCGHDPSQDNGWIVRLSGSEAGDTLHLGIANEPISIAAGSLAEHRFDVQVSLLDGCRALRISAGADTDTRSDPVELLRAQCRLALDLLNDDVLAVLWSGADSLLGADYFRRMVGIWLDGGAFPALGLAALVKDERGVVRSVGLDVLVGQDVAVLPASGMSAADQARLAMRVMDFLVREGPVQQDQSVAVDGFGMINMQIDPKEGVINLYR